MQQNQEDLQKANVVKEQKKILESIVYQRMMIQNNLPKANQFPQSEQFSQFQENKGSELDALKSSLESNLTTLNEISFLLGKRINVNLAPITNSNIFKTLDKNYEKLIPT